MNSTPGCKTGGIAFQELQDTTYTQYVQSHTQRPFSLVPTSAIASIRVNASSNALPVLLRPLLCCANCSWTAFNNNNIHDDHTTITR